MLYLNPSLLNSKIHRSVVYDNHPLKKEGSCKESKFLPMPCYDVARWQLAHEHFCRYIAMDPVLKKIK